MSEQAKAIIAVSLIIFILSGSFLYNGIVQYDRAIDNIIVITEKDTNYLVEAMKDSTFKTYHWRIQNLMHSKSQIVEAFAKRNRKLLYELTLPEYETFCCENEYLDIMHFHLPDGTTFLRVHKPDFYGDDLRGIRPIIEEVNRTHKPISGFEIGRHGPFYRVVQPVFYNDSYVGVLEFGISAYQIIDVLASETQIKSEAFFAVTDWQKVILQQDDSLFKIGQFILTSHNRSLSEQLQEGFHFAEESHPLISVDKRKYIVHAHHIFNNFQEKSIGGVVLFQDITHIVSQKQSFILKLVLSAFALFLISIVVLYYTFGRILESLQHREAKLSSIFRAAPAGVGVVVDRKITEVNTSFCEMLGYAKEEFLGQDAKMLYHSDTEYEFVGQEKYRQISEQGTGTVETHMQRKDGSLIDVLLSSTPMDPNDLSAGVTFTATDISGLKDAEKRVRQSENRFRSMMESMSDPVYICSADYHVEYMNPAMIRRTGRDATGENCFKALHDFSEKCPWCIGKPEAPDDYFESNIVSPKDNHSYHVTHSPIVNEDGSTSTMTIFRDTTEFKKMEAQFNQAQKMEAIGTLAGGVAHDFNNILTVIRGHAQLGKMIASAENPLCEHLDAIENAGVRASKLTRQLLDFSRKQAIKPELIMPNNLINDLMKMLKRLVGEDVTLKTVFAEKISPILADPGQLEQIIINLVVNAADAIKGQPMSSPRNITIATSQLFLDDEFIFSHAGSERGWHLLLEVSDNGCGISKEVLERIFEPFFTTKEVGKGTGLGLATVYGIVKQNDAWIAVESEPGKGTKFKIYWPSIKDDSPKEINSKPSQPSLGGDEVVLLVEDEASTRALARKVLQQAGYTVIEAENGLDALQKAKDLEVGIDLLFTDIVMPVMGGKELSEKLTILYPGVEVLFTSGYLADRVNRDDKAFAEERFINKPYEVYALQSKIRELLDRRKL